jgi:hypothetical protein
LIETTSNCSFAIVCPNAPETTPINEQRTNSFFMQKLYRIAARHGIACL